MCPLIAQDSWPADTAPVIRRRGGEVELVHLRWGLKPSSRKSGPIINIRSEGRCFRRHRCLVPASEFFVYTGTETPKTKWSVSRADGDWFYLAGIWRPPSGNWPAAYAILTTAAGPDLERFTDRQMVLIARADKMDWLNLSGQEDELLHPPAAGTLAVKQVR